MSDFFQLLYSALPEIIAGLIVAAILGILGPIFKKISTRSEQVKSSKRTSAEKKQSIDAVTEPKVQSRTQKQRILKAKQIIDFDWVSIPSGLFWMGSDKQSDPLARENELPYHQVDLPKFLIAKTPITNAQYKLFVAETGHRVPEQWINGEIPEGKKNHPVTIVSWYDAQAFCTWAGVRLPTEAEWEKAARGKDGRIYPWGNEMPDKSRCNFNAVVGGTTAVGYYLAGASPYGVLDMAGNVWEFTYSIFRPYPYRDDLQDQNSAERQRVLRGGAFDDDPQYVRCAARSQFYTPNWKGRYGFRVARI
jgi:serine/threonine-protein kinase